MGCTVPGGSTGMAPSGGGMIGTPGATCTPGGAMGSTAAATTGFWPVMGIWPMMPPCSDPAGATVVMSWMLARRLSFLFWLFSRMKYFCAWLATCKSGVS